MSSVHPHVRGCGICNVRFRTHRDLSTHYFESNAHPTCYKCNIGLKTRQDLTDHNNLLHIQFRCDLCKTHVEGTLADIQSHYLISPSHPKCFIHNIGFKNDLEFAQHCAATHPEPGLVTSPLEVDVTESHDDDTLAVTVYTASPSPSPPPEVVAAPSTSSPNLDTSPPLHVSDEPNSLGEVSGDQLREENTGVEANLPRSPDFEYPTRASQPDSSYSTPLHPSSPISETSLEPPPLATIIFREDRTFVQVAPNVHCPQIDSDSSSPTSFTEVSSVDSRRITLVVAPENGYLAVNEDYAFRTAPATPDPITPEPTTPATENDNSITLAASPSDPLVQDNGSASIDALIHAMEVFPSPTDTVVHSPFLGESLNVPAPVSPTFSVSAESHDITLQADLEALDEPIYSPIGRRSRHVEIADDVAVAFEIPEEEEEELGHAQPEGSFLSDHDAYHDAYPKSPIDDEQDLSSNVLYTPHEGRPINFGIPVQDYVPPRPRIRVSTASSSSALTSPSHSPQSDTSEFFCRSPSVSPPADLACLPSISPFELTPIDPPIYELRSRTQSLQITIPEHLNTLLHLASSLSPNVPMTDDLHTPSSLSVFSDTISEALNSGGADWSRSKEIDPLYEDSILAEQLPLPDSVASTPIDEVQSPASLPLWEQSNDDQVQSLLEYTLPSTTRRESLIPRPSISAKVEVVQAAAAPSEPVIPQPRLHCRSCERNPCVDITATMCGHIFCYGCITDAVIKTSKCPVCMTPTLLYCLFRLDLSS
ncbi:hypothetical protein ONZ45_g8584 [Pleurotus djamor]|nr:hypothetical protein ONZ45_g8584 [Pleurotus djamor]